MAVGIDDLHLLLPFPRKNFFRIDYYITAKSVKRFFAFKVLLCRDDFCYGPSLRRSIDGLIGGSSGLAVSNR
jgi:hypothetical protein